MEEDGIGVCEFCQETFDFKWGKSYCSRECKVKAKDARREEQQHTAGLKKRAHELRKTHDRIDPTLLYNNYEANKLASRRHYYLRTFDITMEEAQARKAAHTNCDICGTTEPRGRDNRWHLDHIAGTKIIRGLLCNNCNLGIGFLRHDLEILKNAIKYLEKFSQE